MPKNMELADWLEERQERFITMSDTIWANPQVALAETKACALQAEFLENEGFTVTLSAPTGGAAIAGNRR